MKCVHDKLKCAAFFCWAFFVVGCILQPGSRSETNCELPVDFIV